MKLFLTTTLAALALLITAGCGEDPGFNEDLPDINIPADTVTPDEGGEDTGERPDLNGEVDDATCIVGFGFAGTPESEDPYADMMMSGTQTRGIPIFYRDCEGDDSDRLVTFELVDGETFCELKLTNDYTDEEGIAYGSISSKQKAGFCHVKACAEDQVDVCVTVTILVQPKGIPPLNVDFEPYDGNYALKMNAVKVRLIKQTEEKKVMCADIDPRAMVGGDLDSNWASINEIIQFASLPGLKDELAQDYTIIAMAYEFDTEESEANPMRAWSCDDTSGHVEYGDQTWVTMRLWDIPPRITGSWDIDSNFDLISGLPPTVEKILNILIGLFTDPTGQILMLMCDETILGLNIGNDICGYIFSDPEDPVLGEYGAVGTFVVEIVNAIIENLLINNCPYEEDPDLCSKIYFTVGDVGAILQKFRIKSTMTCDVEPKIDWGNPEAGAIIEEGDCREVWHTVIFRWSLGKGCDPSDEECGAMYFSMAAIPGIEEAIRADISGALIDAQYLQIDQHSVNLKYGALINFALEKILLPQVFGDGSDGLPAVDSYEDLVLSLLAGRQCLSTGSCCQDFDNTLTAKYTWLPKGLAEGACDALVEVAVDYMRDQLNALDATPDNFKVGTPIDDPALMIDNDDNMWFDSIGTQMDKQDWDANLAIGSYVYDPEGQFWGIRN